MIKKVLSFLAILAVFISCEKEEGTGGTSTITGKVKVRDYNGNFTFLIGEFYGGDEDVFIVYGDDEVYGDKVATHYDGTYRFEFLREGNYKVFAYSKDSASYPVTKTVAVIKEVSITGKNQKVKVEDIIILK
jgi:hypothetical protein